MKRLCAICKNGWTEREITHPVTGHPVGVCDDCHVDMEERVAIKQDSGINEALATRQAFIEATGRSANDD